MRIMIVTDAWEPQVNGVVRTLSRTVSELRAMGEEVEVITPYDGFKTMPLPTYPEIKLALGSRQVLQKRFEEFEPEAMHIATEGTLGLTARAICAKHRFPFSTSYHTRFPEYVSARFPVPVSWGYAYVRWFHELSGRVMVATQSMREELTARGFRHLAHWSRGVDTELYNPARRTTDRGLFAGLKGPVFLYVGRVAVEKNVETFLSLDLPGSKAVIGDGPQRAELEAKFPEARFLGARFGEELAKAYADADVFVFPSLTDTFGLVILEAMAAGTPVAAFMAPGPRDLIPGTGAGAACDDLRQACLDCLTLDRATVRAHAEKFSWRACTQEFLTNLMPLPPMERRRFWRRWRRRKPDEVVVVDPSSSAKEI